MLVVLAAWAYFKMLVPVRYSFKFFVSNKTQHVRRNDVHL